MFYYSLVLFYTHLITIGARKFPFSIVFLSLIPVIMFATFRGSSGKDSYLYLRRFRIFDNQEFNLSIDSEPFLDVLIYLSKYILNGSHEAFFFLHALIVCFLFALIIKKYNEARVYLITVAPVILIDGLTNGMRITLAYHLFAVSILYGKKFLVPLLVVLSHFSGALLYIFNLAFNFSNFSFVKRLFVIALLGLLISFLYLFLDEISLFLPRVTTKLSQYSSALTSSNFAGIVDVFIIATILVLAVWFNAKGLSNLFLGIFIAICVSFFFFVIFQYSIAAIRIGKLFIVVLCLSHYLRFPRKKIPLYVLLPIGALYTINFMRAIYFGEGFLPYPGLVI